MSDLLLVSHAKANISNTNRTTGSLFFFVLFCFYSDTRGVQLVCYSLKFVGSAF